MILSLKKYNCKLLAEKIETYEEFEKAMALGFTYFQGYFFSKPEVLKNKDLSVLSDDHDQAYFANKCRRV